MTSATGTAMHMRIDLSRYPHTPPFTPIAPRPAVDHDISIEGLAAPATIDRERMKFASGCWTIPLSTEIPLLFRHQKDRPAGRILDIESRDAGLFVRATITDPEARTCPYFSVLATVHHYELREANDPKQAYALIGAASVDEVSLVFDPGNPDAIIHPTPAAIQFYDLAIRGVGLIQQQLEVLMKLDWSQPSGDEKGGQENSSTFLKPDEKAGQENTSSFLKPKPHPFVSYRIGEFGSLVSAMERNHHEPVQERSRA